MKKLLVIVATLLMATSSAFAQAWGGMGVTPADIQRHQTAIEEVHILAQDKVEDLLEVSTDLRTLNALLAQRAQGNVQYNGFKKVEVTNISSGADANTCVVDLILKAEFENTESGAKQEYELDKRDMIISLNCDFFRPQAQTNDGNVNATNVVNTGLNVRSEIGGFEIRTVSPVVTEEKKTSNQ